MNGGQTLFTMGARLASTLDRVFRQRRFDVVHVHNPFGVMLAITAIRRSPGRSRSGPSTASSPRSTA